jgi:protein PhnA
MKLDELLQKRSNNTCELCSATAALQVYEVAPQHGSYADSSTLICNKCVAQINKKEEADVAHWQALLANSIWHEVPAIKVISWRMLNRFRSESWAADSLDMLYLEDEWISVAKATGDHESDAAVDLHRDCNGQQLLSGDTVVLIKSLDVKGSTLNAKLGTVVKNIRLVNDNTEQIEGKIEGQTIVILTKYLRKQGIV